MNSVRRHRTFDGAYRRFVLANPGYAIMVLRPFDVRFYESKEPFLSRVHDVARQTDIC